MLVKGAGASLASQQPPKSNVPAWAGVGFRARPESTRVLLNALNPTYPFLAKPHHHYDTKLRKHALLHQIGMLLWN